MVELFLSLYLSHFGKFNLIIFSLFHPNFIAKEIIFSKGGIKILSILLAP
jgi:hypothetical protein